MKYLYLCMAFMVASSSAAEESLSSRAEAALQRALAAMATAQHHGGWADSWTENGMLVWGQSDPMPAHWITVQPPATPDTAKVYLRAAQVLADTQYAERAFQARDALLKIQTVEGGFDKESDPTAPKPLRASFDDDVTTGALDFLIKLWQHTGGDRERRDVLTVAEFILKTQYADSGGWPQQYPPNPENYKSYITFNDDVMANAIRALLHLHRLFGDERYFDAAIRGGECIIRLQGGPGEAVWAQQYDPVTLQPAWARVFEPPGYSASESRDICELLIDLYLATGQDRFLEPLPKAFAWYDASRLPNGKWARLYEPSTKRPVYGQREKPGPVYDVREAVGGYRWQYDWYPYQAKKDYERIKAIGRDAFLNERANNSKPRPASSYESEVRTICDSLTPEGWWISAPNSSDQRELAEAGVPEDAWRVVSTDDFCDNANTLLDYIERVKAEK